MFMQFLWFFFTEDMSFLVNYELNFKKITGMIIFKIKEDQTCLVPVCLHICLHFKLESIIFYVFFCLNCSFHPENKRILSLYKDI
jgi:hypothetical protein